MVNHSPSWHRREGSPLIDEGGFGDVVVQGEHWGDGVYGACSLEMESGLFSRISVAVSSATVVVDCEEERQTKASPGCGGER